MVPSFTATLYVDLERSVTLVGTTWKPISSANVTGNGESCVRGRRFCDRGFESFGNCNVARLAVLEDSLFAVCWILLWEGPTCSSS